MADQPMSRPTFDPDRFTVSQDDTVLLIVDIQERLAPVIHDQAQVVAKTVILAQAAAEMNLPVLLTEQYPRGLGATLPAIALVIAERLPAAQRFEKMAFSACTPEVMAALAATGRRKVIITGMETHVCVFQTTRQLLAEGYQVFLAADAVSSRTPENRQNALDMMAAMGAVISNTETLIFDLLKVSGTPLFKSVSRLIK